MDSLDASPSLQEDRYPPVRERLPGKTLSPTFNDKTESALPCWCIKTMPTPRTDHLDNAYPPLLRTAETSVLRDRRQACALPLDSPTVGFALSGGGIRSATFCLGLFQALARVSLVRRIDFVSSVSGGGYFASFLGAAFSRPNADNESVEAELRDNHSWSLEWLRNNGRFLSPNGSGDTWHAAAVAIRNWAAVHVVVLTFGFLLLGLGILVRTQLWAYAGTSSFWQALERFWWSHHVAGLWWSPWTALPLIPIALVLIPAGSLYWLTQFRMLMRPLRAVCGLFSKRIRQHADDEFANAAQARLTRAFLFGLLSTVTLLTYAAVDSLGQTVYLSWSKADFTFPTAWTMLTASGAAAYTLGGRVFVFVRDLLGRSKFRITFETVALVLALTWLLLIVVGLSVLACGFAWGWVRVESLKDIQPGQEGWQLVGAVMIAFVLSWWFSRSFSFVNLSSLQQVYASRIRRAYIGASNPDRREKENYSMTELVPGDDYCLEDYEPHLHGGPLHFINVTVNETVSGKTQIERVDRKGLAFAVGPCGISVGADAHALWAPEDALPPRSRFAQALWENRSRWVQPIARPFSATHPLGGDVDSGSGHLPNKVEALSLGRWAAISGAAFTTGIGAGTQFGLSLLLGLANVRLGYWWDSGIAPNARQQSTPVTILERAARLLSRLLPVQSSLMTEFFARFHGTSRRHWYLSDGGHFENTACYELIRRRVRLIVCSDAGQDPSYQFSDLANLIRKARTDFGAEIQLLRSRSHAKKDDPGSILPLPVLEDVVHPELLDVIGSPEDFPPLVRVDPEGHECPGDCAKKHALLARIHYADTGEVCWLLILKPSVMSDEPLDVMQYQRTHPLFPQEPTSDQYFDEAQWESYRKLGEHIGTEVFSPVSDPHRGWTPFSLLPVQPRRMEASSAEDVDSAMSDFSNDRRKEPFLNGPPQTRAGASGSASPRETD